MLPVVAASTIQFRRGGLLVATLSTVLYGGLVLAQYLAASGCCADPWLAALVADAAARSVARYTVALNVFGFFAVALLSGSLADSLRSAGARLEQASTEIADLQALNQHVIDSLPSGLATTDPALRILTFNRGAEAITGVPFQRGRPRRSTRCCSCRAPVMDSIQNDLRSKARAGVTSSATGRDDGRGELEIGLTATHLETPGGRAGLLFTFQDVTDDQEARARRGDPAAARGGRRDGGRHRARDPQPAGVDVGLDSDPAPGAAAQQRAGAVDGHRAARVGAAEHHHPIVSRLRAAAAVPDRSGSTCAAR